MNTKSSIKINFIINKESISLKKDHKSIDKHRLNLFFFHFMLKHSFADILQYFY